MGDSTYKTYVTRQIALYNDMFIAIGRTDLQDKFQEVIESEFDDDEDIESYTSEINAKE